MNFKALDRITGYAPRGGDYAGMDWDRLSNDNERDRQRRAERRIAERRNHRFSEDIGGCSANYREPYFS